MQRPRLWLLASLIGLAAFSVSARAQSPAPMTSDIERFALHHSEEWESLASHLPDPATASAAELEIAGDVLRARRFPEDALDYYGYAMARGGKISTLLNKMGIVRLELRQVSLAHEMFQRVVHEQKKNAAAWNNLGVTEFVLGKYGDAITDYKRASSLNKHSAAFHTNLAIAYFKKGDVESSRSQFVVAMAIDPHIMQTHDSGGEQAHIVDSGDYPKLCFELAKLSARQQRMNDFHLWLARAGDGGFDIEHGVADDAELHMYLKDPQVQTILTNARELSRRNVATMKGVPSLGPASPNAN